MGDVLGRAGVATPSHRGAWRRGGVPGRASGRGCGRGAHRDNRRHGRVPRDRPPHTPPVPEGRLTAVYDFLCLDCGEAFAVDSAKPVEGTQVRCPDCHSAHIRQTFESFLRNADAARALRRLDELRCGHFG